MWNIPDLCLGWTNWVPYKPCCPDFRTVLAHKHAHTHTHTHEWLLPFVSFRAKPNPALPAVERERERERENHLPPFSSNSLFNFKVLYWQGSAWAKPRQLTKTRGAFEAKRKQLWHYIIANTTIRTIIISIEIISICLPFSFSAHTISGGGGDRAGFSFPLLIVMGHGKRSTKLWKHTWKQRGGSNGRLITANEFLRKWLGLFDCPNVSPVIRHDTWVQGRLMLRVWRM